MNAARRREFAMSLGAGLKSYLWSDIIASPFVFVLIDESTDISTSENMIIYFIHLKGDEAIVSYVGMVHMSAVDAQAITNTLLTFFDENGLDLQKITGFCTNGASVMTSWKNGVAAQLKRRIPFMQSVHCIAHRLALCCTDAAVDLDYQQHAEVTVNEISSYFNCSGKRTVALQEVSNQFAIGRTKSVKSGKTRWLSTVLQWMFCI